MKLILTYLGLVTTLAFAAAATSGNATAGNTETKVCSKESCSPCPLPCGPGSCATACVATNQ